MINFDWFIHSKGSFLKKVWGSFILIILRRSVTGKIANIPDKNITSTLISYSISFHPVSPRFPGQELRPGGQSVRDQPMRPRHLHTLTQRHRQRHLHMHLRPRLRGPQLPEHHRPMRHRQLQLHSQRHLQAALAYLRLLRLQAGLQG